MSADIQNMKNMDSIAIAQKIFTVALPVAQQIDAPTAYINIVAGADVPFTDRELWESFNKIRWDTELSSAELKIMRMEKTSVSDTDKKLAVVSISEFEDETGLNRVHNIPPEKGVILS